MVGAQPRRAFVDTGDLVLRSLFLVHSNPEACVALKTQLCAAGWKVIVGSQETEELDQQFWQAAPDVVLVGLEDSGGNLLDFALRVLEWKAAPVVLLGASANVAKLATGATQTTVEDVLRTLNDVAPCAGVVNIHGNREISERWQLQLRELCVVLTRHGWRLELSPDGYGSDVMHCIEVVNLDARTSATSATFIAQTLQNKHLRDYIFLFLHSDPGSVLTDLEEITEMRAQRYAYYQITSALLEAVLGFVQKTANLQAPR